MNNGKRNSNPFAANYRSYERKRCRTGTGKLPIYRTEIKEGAEVYVQDGFQDTYHIIQDLNNGITPSALVERYRLSGGIDVSGLSVPNMGYVDNTVIPNDQVAAFNTLKNAFAVVDLAKKHNIQSEADLIAAIAHMQQNGADSASVGVAKESEVLE